MNLTNFIRAVIFDLDGTLVDSAGEIAVALNRTLDELALPNLSQVEVEALIGGGVRTLIERALARLGSAPLDRDASVARFETHYANTVGTQAKLFPGVLPGLRLLKESGYRMSVVTNKPRFFTLRLLEGLEVATLFTAVVAGDDGLRRKPHGDMLAAACKGMGLRPVQSLMVGDSENDVVAARAAGCPVWCVPYGYNEGRAPATLKCDRLVETVEQAARLLLRA